MSITRDIGKVVRATHQYVLMTASTGTPYGYTSTAKYFYCSPSSWPSTSLVSTGHIIDRLDPEFKYAGYLTAEPICTAYTTAGTTEGDCKLTLFAEIQTGDSSGLGDMAPFSTAKNPGTRVFGTTVRTSEYQTWSTMANWGSTSPFYGQSWPYTVDLRDAKRYLRVRIEAGKNRITTESSGLEGLRADGYIRLGGGQRLPDGLYTSGPFSTSTSTST